jgi:hypothetical protein
MFPLIKNFKSDTIFNAFTLNATTAALIAAFAVEFRLKLANKESGVYIFFNKLFSGVELHENQAFVIEFFTTLIVAFLVFQLMHLIFDFGGGMMV